ncbi:unnamed protein product [Ostreobium quekettii]|uniref:Hexosyltransferase n=1 Tax=Ostreobium quekettii TaxID=121088 RepID=A0A8S1J9F4_9CHLO|nr:unnamed protein product [Ostreobium quekettii]|eukprot:evm.model.scf_3051.1 EVM.evm.TU.scf_3051.1   scf_3051:3081-8884(+)
MSSGRFVDLIVGVCSAGDYVDRRRAIRKSWFLYARSHVSPIPEEDASRIAMKFIVSQGHPKAEKEQERHNDIAFVDAPEGYGNLWRKVLLFLYWVEMTYEYRYFMHADDDSFVRLDLILQKMIQWPSERFYWGYIWNMGPGRPFTQPIRDPRNKSHMPPEQYPLDYYPPFASGCGFALSRDLCRALLARALPDYRLLDAPFGIHLCGLEMCVLEAPVVPVHDEGVRPYRAIPLFHADTVVQHYMRPEEMKPFFDNAIEAAARPLDGPTHGQTAADDLYKQLVDLGLLRR